MQEKLNQLKIEFEKKVKRIERYEKRLEQAKQDYIEGVLELAEMMKEVKTENEKRALEQSLVDVAIEYAEREKQYKEIIDRTKISADELRVEVCHLESEVAKAEARKKLAKM